MSPKWIFVLLIAVFALALAACGGAGGAAAPTFAATAAVEPTQAPTTEAAAPTGVTAEPTATAELAPTEAPAATVASTATLAPTATAPATTICPDVPRPALLLYTGAAYELADPLSGERCDLPLPGQDSGAKSVAGEWVYFLPYDPETQTAVVNRLNPDGTIEALPATEHASQNAYLMQFAVAPDESRLAWATNDQTNPNLMEWETTLWIGAADGSDATAVLENVVGGQGRIGTPVRFSADGQTIFFTWQPIGLGGMWNAFNGRFDNLYRMPAAGGELEKVFDCADLDLFLCVGDFRDDGTLAYVDTSRAVHVVGPDGAEAATIPTAGEYAGYPTFNVDGDLFYSTAVLPATADAVPFPSPGTLYRVAAPYTGAPEAVASADGLLTAAMPAPFLDATHLVVQYAEGDQWGTALVDTASGTIAKIEPWPNAYLQTVWPAE